MSSSHDIEEDDRPRWSFSSLSTYADCSEMYRLSKIVKPRLPSREAPWFVLGQGVHRAIERWLIEFCQPDIVELFYQEYDKERAEALERQPDLNRWNNPGRSGLLANLDSNREKGALMVSELVRYLDEDSTWQVNRDEDDGTAWVEVPFDLDFDGIRVVGSIDAVGNDDPLDWKTGNASSTKPLQLGIYSFALGEQYGLHGNTGQFFYLGGAADARKTFGPSKHYDTSRYNREYLTELFTAAQAGVEAGVFLPNPGDLCQSFCDYKEFCREMGSRPIPLDWESVDEPWWVDTDVNL